MAVQLSVAVRNARLDQIESTIGVTPFLDFRTGAQPADCSQADAGTELEHMALPSDWMAAAAAGVKGKAGTWQSTADAAGIAAHFRIKDSGDTTCHIQGSITGTGGGGDMELDNVNIALGQTITITQFDLTDGNA
tara:strand:+ start:9825 stop:10229 length:405 start_codon:yes stop_codon:yes gene_type:complete